MQAIQLALRHPEHRVFKFIFFKFLNQFSVVQVVVHTSWICFSVLPSSTPRLCLYRDKWFPRASWVFNNVVPQLQLFVCSGAWKLARAAEFTSTKNRHSHNFTFLYNRTSPLTITRFSQSKSVGHRKHFICDEEFRFLSLLNPGT